jgi:hypothetical protein
MSFFSGGLDLIGFWLGVTASYVLAVAMIAGGLYVAIVLAENPAVKLFKRSIRFAGMVLFALGCILGAFTFGSAHGAEKCEAAWKAKNYEAQIARLQQERDAKDVAAKVAEDSLKQIATQKEDADGKVAEYQVATAKLEVAVASCRRASDDDDRRMYDITGRPAASGKPTR